MPSLLQNAYGDSWGSGMINGRTMGSQLGATLGTPLGNNIEPSVIQEKPLLYNEPVNYIPSPPDIHRGRGDKGVKCQSSGGDYVLSVNLTIDQQDCHLLCLFLGVFTLAILFSKNKKLSTSLP